MVIAGFATLALAMRDGGADSTPSEVRRTAQIQVEDTSAEQRAAAMGMEGRMERDAQTGALTLTLTLTAQVAVDESQLQLRLLHPSRAAQDRTVLLARAGTTWHGRIEPAAHAWNLRLEPQDGRWRLAGRLAVDATEASLRPAVSR